MKSVGLTCFNVIFLHITLIVREHNLAASSTFALIENSANSSKSRGEFTSLKILSKIGEKQRSASNNIELYKSDGELNFYVFQSNCNVIPQVTVFIAKKPNINRTDRQTKLNCFAHKFVDIFSKQDSIIYIFILSLPHPK